KIAREVLRISRRGLRSRRCINAASQDESVYLDHLDEVAVSGRTLADRLIEKFEGPWSRQIDHVFEEYAF
ncbi:MAG: glutamate--cysteine ligase, partial [Hyphomicrobium sp.]